MEAIFKEKDFVVCDVPVPLGYPQSQTHAGVAHGKDRVYLTSSPYPKIRYNFLQRIYRKCLHVVTNNMYPPNYGDAQENPMLYWGDKNNESPSVFKPYFGNPLANTPPKLFGYKSYNSDPDVYVEDGLVYVLNRECFMTGGAYNYWVRIFLMMFAETENGVKYLRSKIILEEPNKNLSPCIVKWQNSYKLLSLETLSYNTGDSDCHLILRESSSIDGVYNNKREIQISGGNYVPWHFSVFKYDNSLYAIVACIKGGKSKRLYQMLGKFDDNLNNLTIYPRPLVDIPSYRGAAYVTDEGDIILYSTTDRYYVAGSKSVDGKDIIMMKAPFERVLTQLEKED